MSAGGQSFEKNTELALPPGRGGFARELNGPAERPERRRLAGVPALPPSFGVQERDPDVGTIGGRDLAHEVLARRTLLLDRLDTPDERSRGHLDRPVDRADPHDRAAAGRPL